MITGTTRSNAGGTYSVNSIYGKGLINAHVKAESQHWAGTVIDESVVQKIAENNDIDKFLTSFAMSGYSGAKYATIPLESTPVIPE